MNGVQANQTSPQMFHHQAKNKTDLNMAKLKDYSDQNELLAKSSEYNQSKRKS